jgi:diacylglycerol O-acyltransferase
MRRIDLADASFLYLERREVPMHVGGLFLFTPPEDQDREEFLASLYDILSAPEELRQPFGDYVTTGKVGAVGGLYWEKDRHIDMDYHVRHSALPQPGRYRELFVLVSRLHSTLLDRNRPLWEAHLIEGLETGQIALYLKMHHSTIDGVGALKLVESMCSTDPTYRSPHSPLSQAIYEEYRKKHPARRLRKVTPRRGELQAVAHFLKQQLGTSLNLLGVLKDYAMTWLGAGGALTVPWRQIPLTTLNSNVSGSRRFVAQSWSLDRFRAVGDALGGTVNDVVLAVCAGALRRYLIAQAKLPGRSLKAMVPVALETGEAKGSGNAISFITADLATQIEDPAQRFAQIRASMLAGKHLLKGLSAREATLLWQITQASGLLVSLSGLAPRIPAFSATISNVPGPDKPLYWNGARLDGIYPASIPFDGMAINITLIGYNNNLDFGIVACRRSVPGVQRMVDYMDEALVELEATAAKPARKPLKKAPAKKAARKLARKTGKKTAKKAARKVGKKVAKKTVRKVGKKLARKARGKAGRVPA